MKLAAHPFSPRTRRLVATSLMLVRSASPARLPSASLQRISRQSRDCLRVRVRRGCAAVFTPSALFPGISRRCTGAFRSAAIPLVALCRIRFNRATRSAWHLRYLALRRDASLRNLSASAQADSLCAERNAPSLVSATLPPYFTQATAPHARSWLYSTLSANRIVLRNPTVLKVPGHLADAHLSARASCRSDPF